VTRELARRLRAVEAELAAARAEIAELKRQLMTSDVVEAEAVING
jgi:phage terminase Nu1 subunit (DNA packaging protein)